MPSAAGSCAAVLGFPSPSGPSASLFVGAVTDDAGNEVKSVGNGDEPLVLKWRGSIPMLAKNVGGSCFDSLMKSAKMLAN